MIFKLIASRLALALVTLLAVSAVVFFFTEVLPGDIAARVLGRESSPEQRAIFRKEKGLDRPVLKHLEAWWRRLAERPGYRKHLTLPLT